MLVVAKTKAPESKDLRPLDPKTIIGPFSFGGLGFHYNQSLLSAGSRMGPVIVK